MNKYRKGNIANVNTIPRLELYDWLQLSFFSAVGINYLLFYMLFKEIGLVLIAGCFFLVAFIVSKDDRADRRNLGSVVAAGFCYPIATVVPFWNMLPLSKTITLLIAAVFGVEVCIIAVRGFIIWRRIRFRWTHKK